MSVADKLSALATAAAEAAAAMRGVPADAVPPPAAAVVPPAPVGYGQVVPASALGLVAPFAALGALDAAPPMSARNALPLHLQPRATPSAWRPPVAPLPWDASAVGPAEAVENLRRRLLVGPPDRIPGRREQVLQPLMAIDISQLMRLTPGGWIRSDDIADALLARDAEVKEHIRNFQAPGAAESRAAADEAERIRHAAESTAYDERQRIERETQEGTVARAAAEKAALDERRRAMMEQRDVFQKSAQEEARVRADARWSAELTANLTAAAEAEAASGEGTFFANQLAAHTARTEAARAEAAAPGAAARAEAAAAAAKAAAAAAAAAELAGEAGWTRIGDEHTTHKLPEGTRVKFGKGDKWIEKVVGPEGTIAATARSEDFGSDPAPGVFKEIWRRTGGRRRKTRRRKTRHHRRSKTSKRA